MAQAADDLAKIRIDTAVLTERTEQIEKRFGHIQNIFMIYSGVIAVLLAFAGYGIFSTRSEVLSSAEKVAALTTTLDQVKNDVAAIRTAVGEDIVMNMRDVAAEMRRVSQNFQENITPESIKLMQTRMDEITNALQEIRNSLDELKQQ
jgi:hypothetical protein